jgi:hypothetical protein
MEAKTLTDDGVSRVLSQGIRLSSEDQARLIEWLKQHRESPRRDPLEPSTNSTHAAEVHPATQEQVAANCEVNDKSSPLNFAVEDGLYGKLICSYHLDEDFLDGLDVFFSDVFTEEKENKKVVNGNHVIMCREEALRLLQEKIERNIRDAMDDKI